ncbi:MAG TPA: antibiotic biosynthesis monooxygenase family protein [Vicinamibacterales bacterium]
MCCIKQQPVKDGHDRWLSGGIPRYTAASGSHFAAGTRPAMHIATMNLRVRDDKRSEALSAIDGFIRRMRSWPGCLTCRLLADASDGEMLTLVSEWDSREGLDGFIASREFLILQGMRMVLRDDPQVILDEILLRSRMSLGAKVR